MRIIAFLVLLITPLLVVADPEDPEITELLRGHVHTLTMDQDSKLYFQCKIPENFVSDLFIGTYLQRDDISTHGIVYVSFADQYPNSTNSSYLSKPINEMISLRKNELKGMKNVYIGVTCTSHMCRLYLDIDKQEEPPQPPQPLQLEAPLFIPEKYIEIATICFVLSIVGCTLNLIVACILEKTREGPLGEMTIHYTAAEAGFYIFIFLSGWAGPYLPFNSKGILYLISAVPAC